MWERIKDKLTTLIVDYLLDQFFNLVIVPLISLLGPLLIIYAFRLANAAHHGQLGTWQLIILISAAFISGAALGWRLNLVYSRRTRALNNQVETRSLEIFCYYEHGRIPDHVDVYRKVHSRRNRLIKKVPLVTGYLAKSGYQDIKVQALNFGNIENIRPTQLQRLKMDFVFDDEILPHGTGEMKYRVVIKNKKEEPPPYQMVRASFGPIKEAKLSVRFAPNAVPHRIWRAQWLNGVEGEPELLGEPLEPTHGTTYETTFRNLPGGLSIEYGLYWDWD